MTAEPAAHPAPTLRRDRQLAQYQRALRTLPGGTNSNFRAWGEDTIYVDRGKGGMVWDQDGNESIVSPGFASERRPGGFRADTAAGSGP